MARSNVDIFLVEIEGRLPGQLRGDDLANPPVDVEVVTTNERVATERLPTAITIRSTTAQEFNTRPNETPPDTPYYPNLQGIGIYTRNAFEPGRTVGNGRTSFGQLTLVNGKQSRLEQSYLDLFREYSFDGRRLTIRKGPNRRPRDFRGPVQESYIPAPEYPSDYPAIFTGTVRRVNWSLDQVTFVIRDRQAELANKVLQPETYAGDNVATSSGIDGVEGEQDLEGQRKPVVFGKVFNVPVPNVNTSTLTYQVSSREVQSIDAVYDRGVELTAGTTHASLSALQAATVSAGTYDAYLGANGDGCYIRVETQPEQLSVDATAGATATDRTIGALVQEILTDSELGDIDTLDVLGIDAVNTEVPYEAGIWLGLDDVTYGQALGELLGSIKGWWLDRRDGKFEISRLKVPDLTQALAGFPDVSESPFLLGESQVGDRPSDIRSQTSAAPDDGIVPRSVTAKWGKNYLVQSETAAGADPDHANFVRVEYRNKKRDLATEDDYPLGEDLVFETAFADVEGANWYVRNFTELYAGDPDDTNPASARREILSVRVHPSVAQNWNIGDTLILDIDRFDWKEKPVRLIGYTEDLGAGTNGGQTNLIVWG